MTNSCMQVEMTPSHTGEFIRLEAIDELGLRVARTARILRVCRATLYVLQNGKAALPPEIALRKEKALGVSRRQLLRMQALHAAAGMNAISDKIDIRRYQSA